jgi:hypothetical protein
MASQTLDPFIEKQLLQDIKQTGQLRTKIKLLTICNKSPSIYGPPATPRRRLVQIRFENLKRLSLENYASYLDKFSVPHGPATLLELRKAELEKQNPIDTPSVDPEPEVETASAEDTVSLASAFNNISLETPLIFSPSLPPVMRPDSYSTPPRTLTRPAAIISPGTAVSWKSHTISTVAVSFHEGSKTNPYLVNVDRVCPERNRELCSIRWTMAASYSRLKGQAVKFERPAKYSYELLFLYITR